MVNRNFTNITVIADEEMNKQQRTNIMFEKKTLENKFLDEIVDAMGDWRNFVSHYTERRCMGGIWLKIIYLQQHQYL